MGRDRVARIVFAVTFVAATFSLALQFFQDYLGVWDDPGVVGPAHALRVWRFFSYFTTQSNLLVVFTSFSLARDLRRDGPRWRVARLDALAGITITGLVHWFLLHPMDHFHGWLWASDTLVHIVIPVAAVAAWLVFGPRRRITFRVVLLGLVWPLLWLLYTMVVGGLTRWYPYFFLDVNQTGTGAVVLYCVAILVLLFAVSCLFWLGDRLLPGRRSERSAQAGATGSDLTAAPH